MAIYLEDKERNLLVKLLEKYPKTWWIHYSVLKKVKADQLRIEKIRNCKHEKGTYTGKKTCCVKCDAYFEEGMGFEWMNDFIKEGKGSGQPTSRKTSAIPPTILTQPDASKTL